MGKNERLNTADSFLHTATGFFYQLTDPVYSMDTHTYGAVLPFVRKSAFICVENQNGQ